MFRRYYCSDMKVFAGRENVIHKHDISNGIPEDLPKPNLVFLDPPYWKQATGKYSDSPNDLGNMDLGKFYEVFNNFLKELMEWKVKKIAIVIKPTEYANDFVYEDHTLKFHEMLCSKYTVEKRYILPYSTQLYNAQQLEKAREMKVALTIHRDLAVWRINS